MPVDINNLTDGWLELESDPGLFSLLLEDMGVKGVQVEEVYDLQNGFDGNVLGFIFLFKWIEERRSRRKIVENADNYVKNEDVVNSMFFAQQMVPNSCATHSLVSVLLNCPHLDLGPTLARLKAHTHAMTPENKGWAIGNTPELANAHNAHAAPQARRRAPDHRATPGLPTSSRAANSAETFHFVSYVPISGSLMELDGLKPFPIDHGPWQDGEDWTEHFRRVISERLGGRAEGEPYQDIRFSLMAVVPNKISLHRDIITTLSAHRDSLLEAFQKHLEAKHPHYLTKKEKETLEACELKHQSSKSSNSATQADANNDQQEPLDQDSSVVKEEDDQKPESALIQEEDEFKKCKTEDEEKSVPSLLPLPDFEEVSLELCLDSEFVKLLVQRVEAGQDLTLLKEILQLIMQEIENSQNLIKDEQEKRARYKVDDSRRTHNYDQFIVTFLAALAESGHLGELVAEQLQPHRKKVSSVSGQQGSKNNRGSQKSGAKSNCSSNGAAAAAAAAAAAKKRGRRKKAKAKRKR